VLNIAANISTLFREVPLLERFQAARAQGFDGVEMQFPYSESATMLARAGLSAGMPVILINVPVLPAIYPFGIAGRPEMCNTFRAQLPQICDYAEALAVKFVHVLAGCVHSPDERESCYSTYVDNLLFAAEILGRRGIKVLIEPLNTIDVPNYLLGSMATAQTILDRCGDRIGLQFDAYHVARMGLDPVDELKGALPRVRHLQFADAPGRHEPGTGSVPFESLIAALTTGQYGGWLGAEYMPLGVTTVGLKWLATWRTWQVSRGAQTAPRP
jgi:hydroxypyruvate isomerase